MVVPDFSSGSGIFWEIQPSPAPAEFLAGFAVRLQYVQLITNKTNIDDKSSGVFSNVISFIRTIKIQNSLPLRKSRRKLAKSDVTKSALNCTASLLQMTALLTLSFHKLPIIFNNLILIPSRHINP